MRAAAAVLLLGALFCCSREDRAPTPSPTPSPSPTPTLTPIPTSGSEPELDAAPGCDETALLAAARTAAACKANADCTVTDFSDCWIGRQSCSALPHARTADLQPYRDALAAYHSTCNRGMRCRCARPDAAVCKNALCEATP